MYLTSFKTGEIGVLDPTTLTVGKRIQTNSTPVTLAVDSRRGLGYTSNLFSKSITVVDLNSATVLTTIRTAGEPHTPAVDARTGTVFFTQFQSPDLIVPHCCTLTFELCGRSLREEGNDARVALRPENAFILARLNPSTSTHSPTSDARIVGWRRSPPAAGADC